MGNAPSNPSEPTDGYHVLSVLPGSPADIAGLEPHFDYIIACEGVELDPEANSLPAVLRRSIDNPTVLHVYSSKRRDIRDVSIIPSNIWWSAGPENGLIGCSVRWCSYDGAEEHIWHVLEIQPNSPAEVAGLYPNTDYIIGSPENPLLQRDDLFHVVEAHVGQPLRLFVYNSAAEKMREVMIVPNREWGGEGSLGAAVGYGYLHKIPLPKGYVGGVPKSARELVAVGPARSRDHAHEDDEGDDHDHAHGVGHDHSHGGHDDHAHGDGHDSRNGGHDDHAHGGHNNHAPRDGHDHSHGGFDNHAHGDGHDHTSLVSPSYTHEHGDAHSPSKHDHSHQHNASPSSPRDHAHTSPTSPSHNNDHSHQHATSPAHEHDHSHDTAGAHAHHTSTTPSNATAKEVRTDGMLAGVLAATSPVSERDDIL